MGGLHTTCLRRTGAAADPTGRVQALPAGVQDEQVLAAILASAEAFQRLHVFPEGVARRSGSRGRKH